MDVNEALELIHQYSPVGGMVMDLFAGTCVTGMATLRLNRKCVCVERDQSLVPPAIVRLHQWYRWLKSCALLVTCGNPSPLSCTFLTVWCEFRLSLRLAVAAVRVKAIGRQRKAWRG